MITVLTLGYILILALLVAKGKLPNDGRTWMTVPVWIALLMFILYFPMQIGAPSGQARLMTYSVSIVSNVDGEVVDIPAKPNVPLKKGDVLFQVDRRPFEYALQIKMAQLVDAKQAVLQLQAGLEGAQAAVRQATAARDIAKQTYQRAAAANKGRTRPFSDEQVESKRLTAVANQAALDRAVAALKSSELAANANVDGVNTTVARLEADVERAKYNLEQTTVRAPSDGYITFVALRKGQRVSSIPLLAAMTFIEASENLVSAQIDQIYLRHIEVGQSAELAFKTRPGEIFSGKVEAIVDVSAVGQGKAAGSVPVAQKLTAVPFYLRIRLDDTEAAQQMPAGSVGTAAVYTKFATFVHMIRKVTIRMETFTNYIFPPLA